MGAYTLLQDLTVASNSTSVVLNNFGTITKNDFVKVVFTDTNTGSASNRSIVANNSSQSDYTLQILSASGSAVDAVRFTGSSRFNETSANQTSTTIVYIKLSQNDRLNIFSNTNRENASGVMNNFHYITSSGATFTTGITSFTIAGPANSIGTGSRIQIYKLDAVKIADITVTSNTTQVDISNLNIDKDSEYLLVSDIGNPTNNSPFVNLFVNDNTTATNYFSQQIIGNGSTQSASRTNDAAYAVIVRTSFVPAPNNSIVYTHIKLSNIGAFTFQSYSAAHNTSAIELRNFFGSSTAENITSITKLNVRSNDTNSIAAGSRFTLYKLYE